MGLIIATYTKIIIIMLTSINMNLNRTMDINKNMSSNITYLKNTNDHFRENEIKYLYEQ